MDEDREEFDEVYDDTGREDLLKDDAISPEEQAFMQGYEDSEEDKEESDDDEYEETFDESKRKRKK